MAFKLLQEEEIGKYNKTKTQTNKEGISLGGDEHKVLS